MSSPTVLLIALGVWIATAVGTWFYRGHIDSGEVVSAERGIAAESSAAALKAAEQAARDARGLQAAADVRASRLQDRLDNTRGEYDHAIQVLQHAKLPSCPIPVAAIGVLYAPAASAGGGSPANNPGPVTPGAQGGTVDASAIIANVELNRAAFERNETRLRECIGQYDEVRATVNGPGQVRP